MKELIVFLIKNIRKKIKKEKKKKLKDTKLLKKLNLYLV
jgi:hypothetical protein